MKPYFQIVDGVTELRIPLNAKQARLARRISVVSGLPERRIAREAAECSYGWFQDFQDGTADAPADLAIASGKDYADILAMLDRFRKSGWLQEWNWKIFRRDLLIEIRERVDANDFGPGDMRWAQELLAKQAA